MPLAASVSTISLWRATSFLRFTSCCTSLADKSFFSATFTGLTGLTTAFLTGFAATFFAGAFLTGAFLGELPFLQVLS
jgi:hypothetical protein